MAEYQGVITGIGSADDSINLITPEIDAKLYNYIIGKDTIIIGLVASKVGVIGELTAGMCVYNGYRGILLVGIGGLDLEDIYAKFTINNNTNTPDAFSIVTSSTALTSSGNDYYIKLYTYDNGNYVVNSSFDTAHSYPVNAYNADNATNLVANGTIAASATGVTQSVNDNSTKIATTEYVQAQIATELQIDEITKNYAVIGGTSGVYTFWGSGDITITIKKKAKYAIMTFEVDTYIATNNYPQATSDGNTRVIQLPAGYCPKQGGTYTGCAFVSATIDSPNTHYIYWTISLGYDDTYGHITISSRRITQSSISSAASGSTISIGYEIV